MIKVKPLTHDPTKCRMRQVGWTIVSYVISSNSCRMKSDILPLQGLATFVHPEAMVSEDGSRMELDGVE